MGMGKIIKSSSNKLEISKMETLLWIFGIAVGILLLAAITKGGTIDK